MKLNPKQAAFLSLVRTDFSVFLQQAFHQLYPGQELLGNWHVEALVHALEENLSGRNPRLIINLPPRHLKSFTVSVAWPAFLLGVDPSLKIFCVSYSDELAVTIAADFKRVVQAQWYRTVFPHVRLKKFTANDVVTDQGGFRAALSVHGSITGRGADLIIVDDPCKPDDALSDKARMAVNDWFRGTLLSRRDDKLRSGLIIVMQRLHVNDLTGFIGDSGGFRKISFPAIAEHDEVIELRGGRTHLRRSGEPLHPAWEPLEVLLQLRQEVGSFNFAAQFQQSPMTPEGTLFKRKYFQLVDRLPPHSLAAGRFFISVDTAQSTAVTADFTAISVVCAVDGAMYVVMAERGRWDYEELKTRVMNWINRLARLGQRPYVLVEYAGSGISLSQYLRAQHEGRYDIFWRKPSEDKMVRAARVLNMFEAGVHLVCTKGQDGWVQPYLNEFMNFPNGANDDQVDSLVQLLHANAFRNLIRLPRDVA